MGAIFTLRNFVSGERSTNVRRSTMKSTFINTRNVALLVAAGLLAGTGTAIAEETPAPTSSTTTTKPLTEYQKAKAAYSAAVEAYIANRKSSQAQHKAAVATFTAARKSYNDARKNVLSTYKAELTAARTTHDAAISAAKTDAEKLVIRTAHRSAVATATAKRDAAITALGVAPAAPATPLIGVRPTPPTKPVKAAKTS
jgi:hypothetical protein